MAYFLFSFIGPSQYIAHPSQYFDEGLDKNRKEIRK